jgi:hypothetical protein
MPGLLNAYGQQKPPPKEGGIVDAFQKKQQEQPEQAAAVATPKLPFMAESMDKYGLPYYGEGFKGFARKTFAKIFDPEKLLPKPTEQQAKLLEQGQEAGTEMLNRSGWDEWLESWSGIKGEDVTGAALAMNLSTKDEEGNFDPLKTVATAAGTLYRGGGQVISAGLEALGLMDKASRKVQSFNVALDEIGDASSVMPDITRADEVLKKMLGDTPTAARLGKLINAIGDVTPLIFTYNLIRAGTAGQQMYQKVETVKDNLRASNMLYTMYWDESKKEEYFRRVQAGENPDLVMRDIELPWVELAGSLAGDPSTYLGMGIIGKFGKAKTPVKMFGKTLMNLPWETVGRIPGLTEILGLKNIGKARILAQGDEWRKIASPEVEQAFQALGKAVDDKQAVATLKTAIQSARKQFKSFRGEYGIFSPDSSAKAELTKKTVGTFFHVIAQRFRNPDDMLETFRAFRNLTSDNDQAAIRAFSHLKEVFGEMPFTRVGMQSMEFMSRIVDDVDMPALLAKHGGDTAKFAEEAFGTVNKVVDDMFPSVNDMMKAADEVKSLGVNASERQKLLAKSFDDLKKTQPSVIWANNINRVVKENKAYRGLMGFYTNTMMGMRPAYAMRNLIQNSVVIWHDLGARAGIETLGTGLEVFAKSTAQRAVNTVKKITGGAKVDWAQNVVTRETSKVKEILGFIPTQALKGVGGAGTVGKEGFAFLGVGQDIEAVHSAIITRYMVESEMEKVLRNGAIPNVEALGLPKEMMENLMSHTLSTYGNVAETMKRFRADQATGFSETWRHLELDPKFKDTMRRSGLLDELEDIRKTAPDPVTFSERMDAFLAKIDDLAGRTANEPALVSAENPIGEAVATIEKAFDEGSRKFMSEDELNQFRALVELRSQLRNQYQDYVDVMRDRIGRLLPPDGVRPFEERFSQLRNTLEEGNSKWRTYANDLYQGVYAQSKNGTPPSELWNSVRTVMLDVQDGKPVLKKISLASAYPNVDPSTITNKEFDGMLWTWFKEQQSSFWRGYTQDFITGQSSILDEMAQTAGVSVDQIKMAEYGKLDNPRLQGITDITKQIQDWESHLDYDSFSKMDMKGKTLADMTTQTVPNWRGGKSHLFNAVNADRAKRGEQVYATIDEVPFEEASRALKQRTKPIPPYVEGTQPTTTRQLMENMKGGLRDALEDFRNGTLTKWGQKTPMETSLTDVQEAQLSKWAAELDRRMVSNRAAVSTIADETRNFILHDYNKTQADGFASFFTMYHYWGSRTYMRWTERAMDTPGWPAAYAKLRSTLEKVNSDQPEFYRYNLTVPQLPGLNNSPMYFNLEALLNPMYSLTGSDFNDPKRRVDWLSSSIDDMGKFGFNMSVPLQWAMAFRLYNKGEDEAARRWLGRMVPGTQDLKAGLNMLKENTGIDLMPDISILPGAKYGEFDPFINMQGGFDAYEEKRIGRMLADMVLKGEITPEQAYDTMYNRDGADYDEAVTRAIMERAPGQMASFFGGVGFKTRTEGDLKVEEFYQKYYKLLSMRETISPENYRAAFDQLRGEYQFADTVLLAARGGDERDSVYAYNVLSRIPPGDSTAMLEGMGLSDELVQKFYNDKGDFSQWTPQDRDRFMGAMLDLGATLALPDDATRSEWNAAKEAYKDVQEQISEGLGMPYAGDTRGVWDMISTYYDIKDTNPDAAEEFKANNPEIDEAFSLLAEAKINDPYLARYYASIDTVESYYSGKIRAQLFEKYGKDILVLQSEYYEMGYEGKSAQKAWLTRHPQLRGYWSMKKALEKDMNQKILQIASSLPSAAPGAQLRSDFDPANETQSQIAGLAQSTPFDGVAGEMTPGLQESVFNYISSGTPLPKAANSELEYLAKKFDFYNADDLLRTIAYSMMEGQQPEDEPPPQGGLLSAYQQ